METIQEGPGSLHVISTPGTCTVRFRRKTLETSLGTLNLSYVPAGPHRIVVSWKGTREPSTEIMILGGQRTIVTVKPIKGSKPFDVSHKPE
ncbi:MAG: hypothetical protein LAO05_17990 [Acidobacteriia bacterium]|nr:hypothetical protein [Terriglobia bacterium]